MNDIITKGISKGGESKRLAILLKEALRLESQAKREIKTTWGKKSVEIHSNPVSGKTTYEKTPYPVVHDEKYQQVHRLVLKIAGQLERSVS
jgi:hypothetical protein